MKGLENMGRQLASRLITENLITPDHRLKQDARTQAVLDHYPAWILAYDVEPLKAVFISSDMAQMLDVPPGFIRTENEYKTVHHCDMTTSYNRFQTFEYYHGGGTGIRTHVATIMLPDDTPVFVDDLAIPLIHGADGRTTCYAHLFVERCRPSMARAYAFCDPDMLTPKQKQVFNLILMGWSPNQIGAHLCISPKTLEKHIAAILSLTGQLHTTALLEICTASE